MFNYAPFSKNLDRQDNQLSNSYNPAHPSTKRRALAHKTTQAVSNHATKLTDP